MAAKTRKHNLYVMDFDDAVKKLLDLLRDSTAEGKTKAFFFGGWHGLGASAVLRALAELLKSRRNDFENRKRFGKIIHVDCSLWKNRRMMQRAIAGELNLHHLMPMFDKQDEDDDFRGVDNSSRAEVTSVGSVIHESLIYETFLMIFHYGGDEDIDLVECGIPNFGKGKILWTNHGRFQLSPREQKLMSSSDTILMWFSTDNDTYNREKQLGHLLHKEAVEVSGYTGMDDIDPAKVVDCFLYTLFLTEQVRGACISVDYGWVTHACNYWICDGIFQGNRAWEIGSALYGAIPRLGYPSFQTEVLARFVDRQIRPYNGWISVKGACNISTVPVNASSYFLTISEGYSPVELPNDLFQLASNLRVLKLQNCIFDFACPPFQCCHNLRFLWLDHCTNAGKKQGGGLIFPNLLVFDLRFTDYVLLPQMVELMTSLRELNTKGVSWKTITYAWKKLQNLHRLRVTESTDVITVDNSSALDMMNLELLDLSGNTHMESLPTLSSARSMKVLVLDGCCSLEHVSLERSPLLESFSLDGYGPAENWTHPIKLPEKNLRPKSRLAPNGAKVKKISLDGCARLHSLFLRALPNLKELDLSGTAIKILDLNAMGVPHLTKLFLLGCDQLRSLHWDNDDDPRLDVLHVDTRGKTSSVVCCGEHGHFDFEACISFIDGRFIYSPIQGLHGRTPFNVYHKVHLHMSSTIHSQVKINKSIEEIGPSQEGLLPVVPLLPYNDVVLAKDITHSPLVWDHRQLQPLGNHIEIGEGSHNLESMHDNDYFRRFTRHHVQSLHVHDNSSITAIPPKYPNKREALEWCHVERCPRLHTIFTCPKSGFQFQSLRIFSAFDLLVAYCIWDRDHTTPLYCFGKLRHIYLHNCPRLVFVLPISFNLPNLETLQIAYCHNLQHVFPLDNVYPQGRAPVVTFETLKHIKLHHLHKLEQICEARLTAPVLETIGLRDCWGLRRLPAIAREGPKPVVDCEKDWWGKLEWDGLEACHDPSLFETHHSAYYKKTIPRGSILR